MKHAPAVLVPLAVFLVLGPPVCPAAAVSAAATAVVGVLCLAGGRWDAVSGGPRAWLAALVLWAALDAALRPVATWDAGHVVAAGVVALGLAVVSAAPRAAAWGRVAAVLAGAGASVWLVADRVVGAGRPSGPLGNPNLSATLALLALALSPFLPVRAPVRGSLVAMTAAGVVASGSRGALIGLAAVALAWALTLRAGRWVWAGATVLVIVAGLGLAARLSADRDPLRWERIRIWGVGLRTTAAELPFGTGPGGYADAALAHNFPRNGEFARFARLPDVAESDFLQVAATLGVPGLLLVGGLVASVVHRLSRRDGRAWGVLAAVAVTSTFSSQLMVPVLGWVVALALGSVLPRPGPRRAGGRSVSAAVATLVLAVAAGAVLTMSDWGVGGSPARAVERADTLAESKPNDDPALADAEAAAWRACAARPRLGRGWRTLGSIRLRRARLRGEADLAAAAVDAFGRARRVNPLDALAALGQAQALRAMGDAAGAWRALNAAVQLEPNFASAWLERAILYTSAGEIGAAREALARAEAASRDAPRAAFVSAYERALAWADPQTVARLRSATGETR
jgi:O-Antigen ligase